MSDGEIARARREADLARERLLVRAHAIQARLKPAAVIEQVRAEVRRNAESGAERVVDAARKRPVAVGAAAAGAAALLAAPPLLRLLRRKKNTATRHRHGDEDDGGQAQGQGRRPRDRDR